MILDLAHQIRLIKLHELIHIHFHCEAKDESVVSSVIRVSVESVIRAYDKQFPRCRFDLDSVMMKLEAHL